MNNNPEKIKRDRAIIRTSVVGIIANVFLSAFKAFVGLMTNSIAIVLDAVNNISDAVSSVITIVGTKLAAKQPDKKHPFGYGRIEYLSAMVISGIVLYAGITSLVESIKKIITPDAPDYSPVALIIVAVGVVVKLILGRYVKAAGKRLDSDALVNSGQDATLDSVISASTLLAAAVFLIWGVSLEAYLGAVISLVIIKSGIEMLGGTLSGILGESADVDTANAIKATVRSFPEVHGVYDLVLNDYGPNAYHGSLHIEVPDTLTVDQLDTLTRSIMAEVYDKHHVYLAGVSVYSLNTTDARSIEMCDNVRSAISAIEHVKGMHGFYINEEIRSIRFDVVVSFDAKDRRTVFNSAVDTVRAMYPEYTIGANMDIDFNEAKGK